VGPQALGEPVVVAHARDRHPAWTRRVPAPIRAGTRRSTFGSAATPTTYSMRRPEIARLMTSCWICSVPSKMSKILASRCQRSTGYSRV